MKRRLNSQPQRRSPDARTLGSCLALILVDSTAWRKKERDLYRRCITELERETARLKTFEDKDEPAFSRWIDEKFGSSIAKFHETVAAIGELEELEHQVRVFADRQRIPLWQAHSEVAAARAAGTVAELLRFDDRDQEKTGAYQKHPGFDGDEAEMFRIFSELASDVFGADSGHAFGNADHSHADKDHQRHEQTHWQRRDDDSRTTSGDRDGDIYLKGLYRQLVRTLHPDTGAAMTGERQAFWAEVQDAYKWGDVHRLSRLHAKICGVGPSGTPTLDLSVMPIGDIMAIRKPVERRLRQLRTKLRVVRRDPAWGFVVLRERGGREFEILRRRIEREICEDLRDVLAHKAKLERLVSSWTKGPKPKPKVQSVKKTVTRGRDCRGGREGTFHDRRAFD